MQPIPVLEILFVLFVVVFRPDTAEFTIIDGYAKNDPITWTRQEDRSVWHGISKSGKDYGIWTLNGKQLTVKQGDKIQTHDMQKYIKGDLDVTAHQPGMKVLGKAIKVETNDKGEFLISTPQGLFSEPAVAIKRSKKSK